MIIMLQRLKRQFQAPNLHWHRWKNKNHCVAITAFLLWSFWDRGICIFPYWVYSINDPYWVYSINDPYWALDWEVEPTNPVTRHSVNCTRSNHTHSLVKYDKCWDSPPYPPPQISPQTILGREERRGAFHGSHGTLFALIWKHSLHTYLLNLKQV